MMKLNMTLDQKTSAALERQARQVRKPCAKLAREILMEGLARREAALRRKKLAADYRAGRVDTRALLNDLEAPQLELLNDKES